MKATFNFKTEREGYGRQGLYFKFDGKWYFIQSVFPNIEEYFGDYELMNDCFQVGDSDVYVDSDNHEVTPIDSWDEFLTEHFKERIGEILCDRLNPDDYEFDFVSASYEEVGEWALYYD